MNMRQLNFCLTCEKWFSSAEDVQQPTNFCCVSCEAWDREHFPHLHPIQKPPIEAAAEREPHVHP